MADLENKQTKKFKIITLTVPAAGNSIPINEASDTGYDRITGVLLNLTNQTALPQGTIDLAINGKEIFPRGYETRNIFCGLEVAPDERFYSLDEKGDQTTILGNYVDGSVVGVVYPYNVLLYVRQETESPRAKFRKLMTEFVKAIKASKDGAEPENK